MSRSRKTTATFASLTLAGSLAVAGGVIYANTGVEAAASSPPKVIAADVPEVTAQDALTELEENRAELTTQQDEERARVVAELELPPGAQFGPTESFDNLDAQISDHASGDAPAANVDDPTLEWYEDGFFSSLMVIDWRCAWLSTGVRAVNEGDPDGAAQAVQTLHDFSSSQYVSAFPDYDYFLDEYVDPLLEGETAGSYVWLEPNCLEPTRVD